MSYRFADSCQLSENLYDIYLCCVYSEKTPDDGQRNCPKHVEFYSKNKFEKLVHIVGFIIRIYRDARSPECQIIINSSATSNTYFLCFRMVLTDTAYEQAIQQKQFYRYFMS